MHVWGRAFAVVLALMLVLSVMVGCGDEGEGDETGTQEEVTIVFTSYGGSFQEAQTKAWIEPFMAANPNIKVVQDEPTEYAQIQAMVESENVSWDVVDVGNDFGIGEFEPLCEPLDPAMVPFDELQPDVFPTTGYRVPNIAYSVVIGYRPDKLNGKAPTSFADFFDLESFPGKRGVYNFVSGGLPEIALIADGVAIEDLYPIDMERALRKLDTIKDQMVWWDTGAQSAQLLADGEVSMGMSWNGRLSDIQKEGAPVEIMWDQHILTADYLVIPKGSKNVDAAMKLIAWITSAEHSAEIARYIDYAPPNINAVPKVDPVVADRLPTAYPEGAIGFDDLWWGNNYNALNTEWQNWVQQ